MDTTQVRTVMVVPCYNEARRLNLPAFRAFLREQPDTLLCMVNAGSTDNTGDVLRAFVEEQQPDRAVLVDMPASLGKADAVRRGVQSALATLSGRYVGYWDADLAAPLAELPTLEAVLDARPEVLLAMGSRVRRLGARIERTRLRHFLGRVFAMCARQVVGMPVHDSQCGAKLMRWDAACQLFERPFVSQWFFDVELLLRVKALVGPERGPQAVCEVPLQTWRDVEDSRMRLSDFAKAPLELLRIRWRYRRGPKHE